jgi:hypothetical protein
MGVHFHKKSIKENKYEKNIPLFYPLLAIKVSINVILFNLKF